MEELSYNFSQGICNCRIRDSWENAGRKGLFYGTVYVGDHCWAIVLFEGDEDPTFHKAGGIEIPQDKWMVCNA